MRGLPGQRRAGARARPHLHPARRSRAERVDVDGAPVRVVGHESVRRDRGRRRVPVGSGARRRQRGGAQHALRHPGAGRHGEDRRVHREGQGQELERAADGLRPSRLQELRSARQADARDLLRSPRRARARRRSAVQARDGAREDRARGRLFRPAQAVSERRLLFGHRAEGDRHSGAALHRDLRAGAHRRLDRAAERDGGRSGVQDRPAAAALHRRDAPQREADRPNADRRRGAAAPPVPDPRITYGQRCRNSKSTSTLFGSNAPFIEELYERYLADPAAVSRRVAQLFRRAARAMRPTCRTRRSSNRFASSRATAGSPARWSTRRRCTSRCSCCG